MNEKPTWAGDDEPHAHVDGSDGAERGNGGPEAAGPDPFSTVEASHRPSNGHGHQMDDDVGVVYAHAVRSGRMGVSEVAATQLGMSLTRLRRAVHELVSLGLFRPVPGTGGELTALDPDVAIASSVSPLQVEMLDRLSRIATLRAQISSLRPIFHELRQSQPEYASVRTLDDPAEAVGSLRVAADKCRQEMLLVYPRHPSDNAWSAFELARDLALSRRGVRFRVLMQHTARADPKLGAYLRRITTAGAEARTVDELSRPFVVFDRRTAFTPDPNGAIEINSEAAAHLLSDAFDNLWRSACPYTGRERGYEPVAPGIQRSIASLLAQGLTDEAVARRLGMSARSCRRHIAALFKSLGSVSRFQAGVRAAATVLADDLEG